MERRLTLLPECFGNKFESTELPRQVTSPSITLGDERAARRASLSAAYLSHRSFPVSGFARCVFAATNSPRRCLRCSLARWFTTRARFLRGCAGATSHPINPRSPRYWISARAFVVKRVPPLLYFFPFLHLPLLLLLLSSTSSAFTYVLRETVQKSTSYARTQLGGG